MSSSQYTRRKVSHSSSFNRQLTLNFAPITFDDVELTVGIMPYESKEELRSLRQAYQQTHLFKRDGNLILSVALIPEISPIGEETRQIKLSQNLYLVSALVRNSLINFLYKLNRKVIGYDPVEFVANPNRENLLAAAVPIDLELPEWLTVCPRYSVAIRPVSFDYQETSIGLVLDAGTCRSIDLDCAQLMDVGVSLNGLYVSKLEQPSDGRISQYSKLIGKVESIDGDNIRLVDGRDGINSVLARDVVLEPRQEAFQRCLQTLFPDHIEIINGELNSRLIDFRHGPSKLKRLRTVGAFISRESLEILPNLNISLKAFLSEVGEAKLPTVHEAPRAIYVFDPAGEKTDMWHDRGLDQFGPYDSATFTPSTPRICIVCQKNQKGRVEQFLYKLVNGIIVSELSKKNKRQPFSSGLVRKYALDGVETKFFLADDSSPISYDRAVREALQHQSREGFKWNLALIQIDESFHDLCGDDNPYLTSKAAFLSEQIPTQDFEIETIDVSDQSLCYVLNNIALATYAKLGGVPWLIKANPVITHELIFGLGSAVVAKGRLGQKERVVGITTVFAGDGNYMLTSLSKAVPMSEYKEALLESLRTTVEKIRHWMNWLPGNHIRLVFHAFKPLKDNEADAVKALMSELGEYDVEYAFVHVVQDHPFSIFDEEQEGVWDRESRQTGKGACAPERGLFLRLSRKEVLLSLTGPRDVKRVQDGLPRPVLLRLHRGSTFEDTTYLARQVYTFSSHSWRSFFPSSMPVTITYSQLIAKMMGQLGTVSFWNPNAMLGRLGETRWFL